jgi:hypothetical protein
MNKILGKNEIKVIDRYIELDLFISTLPIEIRLWLFGKIPDDSINPDTFLKQTKEQIIIGNFYE